jgi:hypothetical protein
LACSDWLKTHSKGQNNGREVAIHDEIKLKITEMKKKVVRAQHVCVKEVVSSKRLFVNVGSDG